MAAAQAHSASGGSSRPMSFALRSASPRRSPSRPTLTVRPPGSACSTVSTSCSTRPCAVLPRGPDDHAGTHPGVNMQRTSRAPSQPAPAGSLGWQPGESTSDADSGLKSRQAPPPRPPPRSAPRACSSPSAAPAPQPTGLPQSSQSPVCAREAGAGAASGPAPRSAAAASPGGTAGPPRPGRCLRAQHTVCQPARPWACCL